MVSDLQKQSNWRCQQCMCCLALLSLCSAGAEVPGTPFPAWPCLSPLPCSQLRLFLPICSGKKLPHVFGVKHSHRFPPSFVTTSWCVAKEWWWALWHSPCFHPQGICPQVSLKGLFAPGLAARLKSSYHRQRKRNILQVGNSLKHWSCSNRSLLLGRRHVQTVVYNDTLVIFVNISSDWNYFLGVLPVPRDSSTKIQGNVLFLAWFRFVSFQVLMVDLRGSLQLCVIRQTLLKQKNSSIAQTTKSPSISQVCFFSGLHLSDFCACEGKHFKDPCTGIVTHLSGWRKEFLSFLF